MALPELQDTSGRLTDCIYFGDPISSSVGSGFVATTRTISTTAPLQGGGDLSANRTLSIDSFAGSTAGAVPASTGGVVTFLRADGAWATPPTFGAAAAGYAPASGGGTTNYLRADGTWQPPSGTGISGLTTGQLPVATAATAIGDSRIGQDSSGFNVWTSGSSGAAHNGLTITESMVVPNRAIISGASDNGSEAVAYGLRLSASAGFFGAATGIDIYGGGISCVGQLALQPASAIATNGVNDQIYAVDEPHATSVYMITGPTAAFSIGGIVPALSGSSGDESGAYVIVHNTTEQLMTVINEHGSALPYTRFTTGTGGNVVIPGGPSTATFLYDYAALRWVLIATNPATQYPRTLGYVPYQNSGGNLADSALFFDSANTLYGFATATPKATVDINGTFATRKYTQLLGIGLNSDIPAPSGGVMRVTGPGGSFSVGGIAVPAGADGLRLTIHNVTSQAMTIVHEDASSTAAHRINTMSGLNVVMPARPSIVTLVYDVTTQRWLLESTGTVMGTSSTTQLLYNNLGSISGDSGLTVTQTGANLYLTLGTDVILSRKATAQLELGVPNVAPSAYKLTGNSSRGGVDGNVTGGKLAVGGGAGTGIGGGGDTALMTAYPGSLGNTQNTFVDRTVIAAKPVTLTESSATKVMTVAVAAGEGAGGTLWYTIFASDATNHQMRRGRVIWAAVNKSGTVTPVLGTPEEAVAVSSGTLTVTVTAVDNTANGVDFKLNAVSSLTQTSLYAWVAMDHDGKGAITTV